MGNEVDLSSKSIDALKTALGGGMNSAAAKPTGDSESLSRLFKDAGAAGGALIQLTTGASGSAIAVEKFGQLLGVVSPALGLAFESVGKSALENKAKLDQATKEGFATNDIFKYNREAAQAGLTTEQWNKTLKDSGAGISGLTGNAARSAEQFSSLAREVREVGPLAQQLQAFGVTQQEMADYTALSLTNAKKLNLADAQSRDQARIAAQLLAEQITETAAATGMSREAVAGKTKAELDNVDSILLMNRMTEEQRQAYTRTTAELTKLGPSVESMGRAVLTGKWDPKDTATLNALGPAGTELKSAILAQQQAAKSGSEEEKKLADDRLKRATADAQAYINSPKYADIALTARGDIAQAQKTIIMESRQAQSTAAGAARETGKTGVEAYREGQKNQETEARANIKGQQVDESGKPMFDAAGKPIMDAGQALTRGANAFDANLRTQTSALATNFERLNKSFVEQAGGAKNVANTMANPGGVFDGGKNTQSAMNTQASLIPRVIDEVKKTAATFNIGQGSIFVQSANYTAGEKLQSPDKKRAGGTLAETGSAVEPEDAIVKIHKGETVLSPEATKGMGKQVSEASKSGLDAGKVSDTINATAGQAKSANASDGGKGKGELEMVLTDYQKTVLKYAATEGEMKKVQVDNEKNIISGTEAQIAESKQRIANIQKDAEGRELTQREQNRIAKINEDIKGFEQEKSQHKEALAVYENVDKLKAQTSADAKKAEVSEITKAEDAKKNITIAQSLFAQQSQLGLTEGQKKMFGDFYGMSKEDSEKKKAALDEERASAAAAHKTAMDARDALEEKAELEGRKLTESEEAERQSLTETLKSSGAKIDAAKDAQLALEKASQATESDAQYTALRAESAKESSRQATEIAKINADEQKKIQEESKSKSLDHVNETIKINGKIVDPNSPEAQAVKNNVAEAKSRMTEMFKHMDPKAITEMALMGKGDSAKQAKEFLMNQVKETMPDPTKLAEKMPSAADLKAQYAKMSTDLNATPEGLTKLKSQLDAQTAKEAEAAKPKAGQVGYIAEKKKDMENMFGKIGGDMFNPVIKDPKQAEINKAKFAEEDKKKAEEDKKKEEPKKEEKPKTAEHEVTIKDLNDQLIKLNSNITKLVSHGEVTADATTKAAKNTKQGRF